MKGNQKAWAAALMTLIAIPLAMIGVGDMPMPDTIGEAATVVFTSLAASAGAWIATYFKRNVGKGGML